jgi:dolichyl-phosphate-mannose-protein mannosyltransferase
MPNPVWILLLILLFSFGSKVFRLGEPKKYYFDEIYYAFTAERMAAGDPAVYDPWAKPPEGVAFEWTHPPTAKLLMAAAVKTLGNEPFAWRIGSALTSTGTVALTALLALELFASWPLALLAALFLSLDGLSLAMGRIATGDSYFIFFTFLGFLAYVRAKKQHSLKYFTAAGLAFGLAGTVKWTVVFPLAFLFLDLFTNLRFALPQISRRTLGAASLLFLIPPLIYLASYGQFFALGGSWEALAQLQNQMLGYHSGLTATHPFSSKPWQWILNLRPVWLHSEVSLGWQLDIFNLGNSVVLIAGFLAFLHQALREKEFSWEKRFLLFLYLALWAPWAISPRVMFFYHYAPAVPLLAILLGRAIIRARQPRRWGAGLMAGAALWFLFTFPLVTGIAMPAPFVNTFYSIIPGLEKH